MSVRAYLGGKPINLGPDARIEIRPAKMPRGSSTAFDFTFDGRGTVTCKRAELREFVDVVFKQRRRGH